MTKIEQVMVDLGEDKSYSIYIGSDILDQIGDKLKEIAIKGRVLVLTNAQIDRLYGARVVDSLENNGYQVRTLQIPAGEEHKNIQTVSKIYNTLLDSSFDRKDTVLALGGGVVGDLAGFVAATYMRGINYVQVPTSLLAQVDSSVGGKTGFNHHVGKNMIGAFYQPKLVLADVAVLKTLPGRELHTGMAEVIKYGLIKSKTFFDFLVGKLGDGVYQSAEGLLLDDKTMIKIVKKCCEIKAAVVAKDEKEGGIRAILNFGHTFGHAIETITDYKKYTHGEAIALGMLSAVDLSINKGYIESDIYNQLLTLYKNIKLPLRLEEGVDVPKMVEIMKHDKKVKDSKIRVVLLSKVGKAVVESMDDEVALKNAFNVIL